MTLTMLRQGDCFCCSAHAEMTNSVTKYFHSDGYLNNQVFGQDVQSALNDPVLRDSRKQL